MMSDAQVPEASAGLARRRQHHDRSVAECGIQTEVMDEFKPAHFGHIFIHQN